MLRLNLPAEVDSSNSTAARSKTTGHLVLTMPKIHPDENSLSLRVAARDKIKTNEEIAKEKKQKEKELDMNKLSGMMQAEALKSIKQSGERPTGGAVKLKGLVPVRKGGIGGGIDASNQMKVVSSLKKVSVNDPESAKPPLPPNSPELEENDMPEQESVDIDEDEPPPIF